ncbi:hypothetical protein N9L06_06660 [Mariniblastus sp.]|nr:hypothetical protein [Mariniblastus sp.]
MDTSNKTIHDLKDAKAYFISMGCSSFHMSRDCPDRCAEYEALKISKSTEQEWRRDSFDLKAARLVDDETETSILWNLHWRMARLCYVLDTEDALKAIYLSTENIADRLPSRERLLVAETIIGGSGPDGSGLILHALKHGQSQIATRLHEIAFSLISSCHVTGEEKKLGIWDVLNVAKTVRAKRAWKERREKAFVACEQLRKNLEYFVSRNSNAG